MRRSWTRSSATWAVAVYVLVSSVRLVLPETEIVWPGALLLAAGNMWTQLHLTVAVAVTGLIGAVMAALLDWRFGFPSIIATAALRGAVSVAIVLPLVVLCVWNVAMYLGFQPGV